MLVTSGNFFEVLDKLALNPELSLDCETTGLKPFGLDRLFSVIFSTGGEDFYFNFQNYPTGEITPDAVLSRALIPYFLRVFKNPGVIYGHHLIFDLLFMGKEGAFDLEENKRELWCTKTGARIEYNNHMTYGLDACAERIGEKKDDAVKIYMDKHKLYERIKDPGKKSTRKNYHFDRVPADVIIPYGEQDARVCFRLAQSQRRSFDEIDRSAIGAPSIKQVADNERRLLRVLYKMQRTGIKLDVPYVKQALTYEQERIHQSKSEFELLTGAEFIDSAKHLEPILLSHGIKIGKTESGRPSIADDVMSPHKDHTLVAQIMIHRDAQKRANTYWMNYLNLVGTDGKIHAWLDPSATVHGRFGCREPNLQNVNSDDQSLFPVRRAFVPDGDGLLVSIDKKQMEYRLMLDYAGELPIIQKVIEGMDVHQATAEAMGTERDPAKTINFMLLYGGGVVKLCMALFHPTVGETALWAIYKEWMKFSRSKWTEAELAVVITDEDRAINVPKLKQAMGLKQLYFEKLPKVQEFITNVQSVAKTRGYIFNWMGRRCVFPRKDFAYTAANYLIAGGCADIMKLGMVRLDEFLEKYKTKMLINVHDENMFWMPRKEIHIVQNLQDIMVGAYKHKHLPMATSVSWSDKSWHDLEDGAPL